MPEYHENWIYELPKEVRLLKHDLFDVFLTRNQSDYYFALLYGYDYPHSQKVREELFEKGILIKIHSERDKKPTFYPCPPTVIYFSQKTDVSVLKANKKIIDEMEDLYFERFFTGRESFLNNKYSYVIAGGALIIGLTVFLMKKFCENEIKISCMDFSERYYERVRVAVGDGILSKTKMALPAHNDVSGDRMRGLRHVPKEMIFKERLYVVDDKILMHLLRLYGVDDARWIGYITKLKEDVEEATKKFQLLYDMGE